MIELLQPVWQTLSPWATASPIESLNLQVKKGSLSWQSIYPFLLGQWCAPLFYELLREHNCLETVPEWVRNRLRSDCLENRLRNQLLKTELTLLLGQFAGAGIAMVLLKGAATFADNLYGSIGARTMLDLDLLIKPDQVSTARALLIAAGYEEIPGEGKAFIGSPTDQRHAHINGYRKPGTPVLVELHFNIAYGQGGRILSAEEGWRHTIEVEVDGIPALILDPTYRLMHNTVHGLIPSCDYIKGRLRLWHLLEFAYLAQRYHDEIDWRIWLEAAARENQATAFLAWLLLANKLLAMPLPEEIPIGSWPRLQCLRLQSATLSQDWGSGTALGSRVSWRDRLCLLLHRGYYFCHLPVWVWRNVCYAEGWRNLPVRMRLFLTKLMSRRSWEKV